MTQQIEDDDSRHMKAKKAELIEFAGRLGDDISAKVTQQIFAAKPELDEDTSKH